MRILVHRAHLPVLLSNAIGILCCSLLNYLAANTWIFPTPPGEPTHPSRITASGTDPTISTGSSGRSASMRSQSIAPHSNRAAIGTSGRS